MKYFVINKQMDFERGFLSGAEYTGQALTLSPGSSYGACFSRIFDSREQETTWHRFTAEGDLKTAAGTVFTFYASDTLELHHEGRRISVRDLIKDPGLSPEQKKKLLQPFERKRVQAPEDILLHEVKGRYFFFLAELFPQGERTPEIFGMTVYFPKEDWLKYLPEVYERDEESAAFTARFLGVFQSFYDDCDRKIREGNRLMEPLCLDYEGLKKLAGWFHFEDLYIWPEEKLRLLIKRAPELLKKTGTVRGMLDFLELYTGEEPMVVECQDTGGRFHPENFKRPYGSNPSEFILLIREEYIKTPKEYQAVLCLVRQMKPAYMSVRLIPLRPRLTLGTYSYLGINSSIGGYSPIRLDGRSSLTFSAVGGEETLQAGFGNDSAGKPNGCEKAKGEAGT